MQNREPTLFRDPRRMGLLLAAVALVVAPHHATLRTPILLFADALLVGRIAMTWGRLPEPSRPVLLLLTLAGPSLVFAEYHRFYGNEPGSALFLVGLSLKLMEMKSLRDVYLVVFLACFVAVTQFLFSQSLMMGIYVLGVVVLLVAAMVGFNAPASFSLQQRLMLGMSLVAQALPLMVVLFMFVPRIAGPLWKLPDEKNTSSTGLTDTLELGKVNRLALSAETAFRVEFDGPPPPPEKRYWRGPVFWYTDGRRWHWIDDHRLLTSEPQWLSAPITYTVTLEPHEQRWILALDLPGPEPEGVLRTADHMLLAPRAVHERARFRLRSYSEYRIASLDPDERQRGLQLPPRLSPRLVALVEAWRRQAHHPWHIVQHALQHYRQGGYGYTLNPPRLTSADPVDEFLFTTKRGFCEHYATAFVLLMRVAGIPARLVTGYQGGQWNEVGRFLEVRQADAHAWAEVWIEERGWVRVDPTAWIAPERVEQGLDVSTQIASGEIRFNVPEGLLASEREWWAEALVHGRLLWGSLEHRWNLWVLSYGPENQRRLLEWLGVVDWRGLTLWLLAGVTLTSAVAVLWSLLPVRQRRRLDAVMRHYVRVQDRLARKGYVRQPAEGVLAFAQRVAREDAELGAQLLQGTALFLRLRYGRRATDTDWRAFVRWAAAFKP